MDKAAVFCFTMSGSISYRHFVPAENFDKQWGGMMLILLSCQDSFVASSASLEPRPVLHA